MKSHTARPKTNNSYLGNKIGLRLHDLPAEPSVLDCFGGAGLIWRAIEQELGHAIRYISIDRQDYSTGFYLPGDNLGYLHRMDLSKFNIIDLDAYSIPYEQLKILFARGFCGRVFVTFAMVMGGHLPHEMLESLGFSPAMMRAYPSFSSKPRAWGYFLEWLAQNGVRTIRYRVKCNNNRKYYLAFDI